MEEDDYEPDHAPLWGEDCPKCVNEIRSDLEYIDCTDCNETACVNCVVYTSDGGHVCGSCHKSRDTINLMRTCEQCSLCDDMVLPSMFFNCPVCEHGRCWRCINGVINPVQGYCRTCSTECTERDCDQLAVGTVGERCDCGTAFAYCDDHLHFSERCVEPGCTRRLCKGCTNNLNVGRGSRHEAYCRRHGSKCMQCNSRLTRATRRQCILCDAAVCKRHGDEYFPHRRYDVCGSHFTTVCSMQHRMPIIPGLQCHVEDCKRICCDTCHQTKVKGSDQKVLTCAEHHETCCGCGELTPRTQSHITNVIIPHTQIRTFCASCWDGIRTPMFGLALCFESTGFPFPPSVQYRIMTDLFRCTHKHD